VPCLRLPVPPIGRTLLIRLLTTTIGPPPSPPPLPASGSFSCEGCEYEGLKPWVENTCTDLVLPEVHGCIVDVNHEESVWNSLTKFHSLMTMLEENSYRVYSSEVNLLGLNAGSCVEYGLKRMNACP
jgi:hypothetical protein